MSGGNFDYKDMELINEIIPKLDNEKDKELIKLVELVGNILHAYDWWKCGDTNEEEYKKEYKQNIDNIRWLLK